jgi:hypothetical protein
LANLDKARKQITDRIDRPARATPFFWQKALSARESGLIASGLLTFALAVVLVSRLRTISSGRRTAGWIAFLGSALLALSTAGALRVRNGAIVAAKSVTAKNAVGAAGVDLFVLHEGAEVRALDESADMSLVGLPDERKGWIPTAALVSTDPRAPFALPQQAHRHQRPRGRLLDARNGHSYGAAWLGGRHALRSPRHDVSFDLWAGHG